METDPGHLSSGSREVGFPASRCGHGVSRCHTLLLRFQGRGRSHTASLNALALFGRVARFLCQCCSWCHGGCGRYSSLQPLVRLFSALCRMACRLVRLSGFMLADAVEVLTAALCLSYLFHGPPRLNSLNALAKYSFFAVFLAPFAGAFVGALTSTANYWAGWRTSFLSEALGFLTLLPAFLGWVREAKAWGKKPRIYYLEAASLIASLVLLAFLIFVVPEKNVSPALLYSLVPFLLWSALRFGSTGISTAVFIIAFLSIWGVTHGEGPFIGAGELNSLLPLQLFLFFTAVPFMILAAVVEEHKAGRRGVARERGKIPQRLPGCWHGNVNRFSRRALSRDQ